MFQAKTLQYDLKTVNSNKQCMLFMMNGKKCKILLKSVSSVLYKSTI